MDTHEQAKQFSCSYSSCQKTFTSVQNLKTHIRAVHEQHRPFVCTVENCGATFAYKSCLQKHARVHETRDVATSSSEQACKKRKRLLDNLLGNNAVSLAGEKPPSVHLTCMLTCAS